MKVLYIYPHEIIKIKNNFYHPFLNEILGRYQKISEDLSVIVSDKELSNFSDFNEATHVKHNLKISPKINKLKDLFRKPNKDIIEEIKKADLIITKLPSFEGNIAVKYAKKYKKKVLVEVVGCPWDAFWNHSLRGKFLAPYMYIITRINVSKADYVIYVSNQFLQGRYPNQKSNIGCSDVVIQPVDFNSTKYDGFTQKEKIILGTSGAIDVSYKSQDKVIKLLPYLNQKYNNVEYHLAGGGDNSSLKSVAKECGVEDKVKFLGLLDKNGVNIFLDQLDFYIQPSKTEGLPRSLVEAMSRSCVCFATSVGGNVELLHSDFLYSKDDITTLRNKFDTITEEQLKENSKLNYTKSLDFRREILDNKRNQFFLKIKNEVEMSIMKK